MESKKDKNKSKPSLGEQFTKGLMSILLGISGFVLFFLIMLALVRFMCKTEGH